MSSNVEVKCGVLGQRKASHTGDNGFSGAALYHRCPSVGECQIPVPMACATRRFVVVMICPSKNFQPLNQAERVLHANGCSAGCKDAQDRVAGEIRGGAGTHGSATGTRRSGVRSLNPTAVPVHMVFLSAYVDTPLLFVLQGARVPKIVSRVNLEVEPGHMAALLEPEGAAAAAATIAAEVQQQGLDGIVLEVAPARIFCTHFLRSC